MKRLSFASEVLTNPPLMFCDEPTSGLDSYMAQNVIEVLRDMSRRGKTIVATIHQPSSQVFELFDRVLLMAEGRVAFLGDVTEAQQFFLRLCRWFYNYFEMICFTMADFFQVWISLPYQLQPCRSLCACDGYNAWQGARVPWNCEEDLRHVWEWSGRRSESQRSDRFRGSQRQKHARAANHRIQIALQGQLVGTV